MKAVEVAVDAALAKVRRQIMNNVVLARSVDDRDRTEQQMDWNNRW